jgi:hypothetical protein
MDIFDDAPEDFNNIKCLGIDNYSEVRHFFNCISNNSLKIFHINIRSYKKNINELMVILDSISVQFDVIVLSETWQCVEDSFIPLDDFETFQITSKFNKNDGVLIYSKKCLSAQCKQISLGETNGLCIDIKKR